MNLLSRYKARILNTFKISLEDWWDDLRDKYLGDDFLDSGKPDVWEEPALPKDIGLTTTVWTELLERTNDSMYHYRNVGGNSSVVAYDTGVDWLLIRFNDSSLYLYTTKSTSSEDIEYMRKLANDGKGLNSYVNRRIGNKYAGRNYKGKLTLMPGMESISNPKALRALQLIIAYENTTMDYIVSQEGIGEMFTKLKNFVQGKDEHGIKGDEAKPGVKLKSGSEWWSDKYKKEVAAIRDAIKRYYLNSNWLDKQGLVTGEVDAKGISGPLNFNGSLGNDPLGNIPKGLQWATSKEKEWMAIVNQYDVKIRQIDKKVKADTIGAGVIDDKGEQLVINAIKEMVALPEPTLPKDSTCGLGNLGPRVAKDGSIEVAVLKPLQAPAKLPALSKEQIQVAAKLMLELLDYDYIHARVKTPYWLDHSDGHKFNDWLNNNYESTYFEYYEFDHHSLDSQYVEPFYDLINEPELLVALEHWVDRSIKGNVSVETISIETFKTIEEKAGKDGLEPNAKKALKIAEELLLKKPSVANEGFWSSIGDFFVGRPTSARMKGSDEGLQRVLRKTIFDSTWLGRQHFKVGQIEPDVLQGFEPRAASRFVDEYQRSINQVLQHNRNELKKILPRLEAVQNFFSRNVNGFSIVDANQVVILLQTMSPWSANVKLNMREPELITQNMIPTPMEALDKQEVVRFAHLLDNLQESRLKFGYSTLLQPKHFVSEATVLFVKRNPQNNAVVPQLNQLVKAYHSLIKHYNNEIRNSMQTHAADINAENIADSLINCMSKSISNINNKGFEDYNVSNEGIWGAIKYLFGGNYENLPKINAAYDEAVDAVKSTYANPQWVKGRRLNTGTVKVKGFSNVANNPQAMFEKVKKVNAKSFEDARNYVKEEVEYLNKFIKALNAEPEKIKALLDMFEVRPERDLTQADDVDLGAGGEVKAKDAKGIHDAAVVFEEAVKYRRATDAIYSMGLYKLAYTDSGKTRYGREGIETARLEGHAKELSLKIGQVIHNVQQSFYNSFMPAWDNIDGVVRGTLMIMEASAD